MPAALRPLRPARRGFTLFEVAVSLLILAISVLAVVLLFPLGIRAEQMARFQLYASAQMVLMADVFASPEHRFHESQYEAEKLGQSTATATITDLERGRQSAFFNLLPILPLPDEIARRLDSDGDEIQRVLDQGAKLFYINPRAPMSMDARVHGNSGGALTGWTESDLRLAPEQRKLVVAIVGYAQQDALRCHPCLGWPYHDFYPSPPTNSANGAVWPECEDWADNGSWPGLAEVQAVAAASRCDLASAASIDAYIDACRER
jgi:prepilin-type N-terminal cleavage/methylation domain-containing protein